MSRPPRRYGDGEAPLDRVSEQYEVYPYPERDPRDERKRLIRGSPSHPVEIDHFVFGGQRDWSRPLRALVAGGGTGDGLIQLAQLLTSAKRAHEITYIDMSVAAREVAEARAAVRGLTNIAFLTGDLTSAPELGRFDYIDCCGVLHHLPDPAAGFAALAAALDPAGGIGFMVYAPYGRVGVYPLQEAFDALYGDLPAARRLAAARVVMERVPEGHPFNRNPHLVDHRQSDAGFYDLLLHSRDRAMDVTELAATLDAAGLELSGFTEPGHYDLTRFAEVPEGMDALTAMAVAEKLNGTIKTHTGYAVPKGSGRKPATGRSLDQVPHLKGDAAVLAREVGRRGGIGMKVGAGQVPLEIPRGCAPLIAGIDGRRSLAAIARRAGVDPIRFAGLWGPAEQALTAWGQLWYSRLLV